MINLVQQKEPEVKRELELSLENVRKSDYNLPRDIGGFVYESIKSFVTNLLEGRKPLIKALAEEVKETGLQRLVIADFCCQYGGSTLDLAAQFPGAEIYGFDILPGCIKIAENRAKYRLGRYRGRVRFQEKDVYDFSSRANFNVIAFNKACGTLADKILQIATQRNTPIIAGRFCCYHTIPENTPDSRNILNNLYLAFTGKINDLVRRKLAESFIKAPQNVDRDLLSNFAKKLGLTEKELEKIAATSVDSKLGTKIINLNRVMKLIERDYDVKLDEARNIVVAGRKKLKLVA